MKLSKIVLSLAVLSIVFASCDDSKKKEAEAEAAAAEAELVLSEEKAALEAEEETRLAAEYEANTIIALAMGNENFSTLVAAINTAELSATLKTEGPFTVFAPTNAAFAKLPKNTLTDLMKAENKTKLQTVLSYHVVAGEWKAADLVKAINENNNSYEVVTVQGEKLILTLKGEKVMIKDAKGGTSTVVIADVDASNGVIHGIDTVVMPKA